MAGLKIFVFFTLACLIFLGSPWSVEAKEPPMSDQGEGGSGHLEGDSQEMAVESVEYGRRESITPGLDSYDEEETLTSFNPAVDQEMQTQLAKRVQQHSELISLTRDLSTVFNELISLLVVLYAITMAALIWVGLNNDNLSRNIMYIFVGFGGASWCLLFCYLAGNITIQSEAVSQALYDLDWLRASNSFKKKMLIAMTVANDPVLIQPTGLDSFSLKLYGEVTYNAYKMIASIQSVVNN